MLTFHQTHHVKTGVCQTRNTPHVQTYPKLQSQNNEKIKHPCHLITHKTTIQV